ncbi:MAG TPA: GWxTD domain-containing protein [Thermoanaerobaculia bacterium]|jgi:GWxTD domain-containing protein|nr:GWxTD domain-containing protein [Thermoanaerobaculia bacterium]
MRRLRILISAALILITCSAVAADPNLPELFKRAKDKFAAGDFKGSLADFELLDTTSAKPENAAVRAKLIPVVTFYRGANLAALGRKGEAKDAFTAYLAYTPTATIASPPFPKATVDLFEQARKEAAGRSATMALAYASFTPPPGWALAPDEHWIESPVRYLLTAAQKKEYATFTTNNERAAFVEAFWKQLDPTPGTDVNEFRIEFERRVAFTDANFATDKQAGRYSDRAPVFVFLGPPTYAAMSNLGTNDDAMASMRANGNDDINRASHSSNSTSPTGIAALTGVQPEDNLDQAYTRGTAESWVYRQDRIPKGVAFQEVHFQFQSKKGYGTGVLQKDPQPMQMLGMAVDIARRDKKLN